MYQKLWCRYRGVVYFIKLKLLPFRRSWSRRRHVLVFTHSSRGFAGRSFARSWRKPQFSVTQKLDSAIHRINRYPVGTYLGNQLRYPLDRDLFNGWRYPPLEQLGPSCVGYIIRIWRIWLLRPFFKVCAAAVLNSIDRIKFDLYYLDGFWEKEKSSLKCTVHVYWLCIAREHKVIL